MALPDRAPRHLGLRQSSRADSRDAQERATTSRDAVVQLTKMGFTFVLDRDTGTPLFPVHEMPVPRSNVPRRGDVADAAIPIKPLPLVRQSLTEADLTNITPEARAVCAQGIREVHRPVRSTRRRACRARSPCRVIWAERSGTAASFDPMLNVLYVNVNDAPTINRLRPVHDQPGRQRTGCPLSSGRAIYEKTCVACHGAERQGTPPHDASAPWTSRQSRQEIESGHRRRTQQHAGVPAVPSAGNERARRLSDQHRSRGLERRRHRASADRYTIDGVPGFHSISTAFRRSLRRGARSMRSIS